MWKQSGSEYEGRERDPNRCYHKQHALNLKQSHGVCDIQYALSGENKSKKKKMEKEKAFAKDDLSKWNEVSE
jgi:hypothetical protein